MAEQAGGEEPVGEVGDGGAQQVGVKSCRVMLEKMDMLPTMVVEEEEELRAIPLPIKGIPADWKERLINLFVDVPRLNVKICRETAEGDKEFMELWTSLLVREGRRKGKGQ